MNNKKMETGFYRESKFIQFETERIYNREKTQVKVGVFLLIIGIALFLLGFKLNLNVLKQPISGILFFTGIGIALVGVTIVLRVLSINKDKLRKELEAQFVVSNLSATDFDEEMEQYGCFTESKPIIVTRHFIIEREPNKTKALNLDNVYFITGTFLPKNRENSESLYMLYDGKGTQEQNRDENSLIKGEYFIEFYDEDGNPCIDAKNKKFIVKTGNEKTTKEILRDIHYSHPWIYMGKEQLHCMNDDSAIEYKLLFDENKRQYLKTI